MLCILINLKFLGTNTKLRLRQRCGIESVIHSIHNLFEQRENEAIQNQVTNFNGVIRHLGIKNTEKKHTHQSTEPIEHAEHFIQTVNLNQNTAISRG